MKRDTREKGRAATQQYHVPALEKGLAILEFLAKAEEGCSLAEVCEGLELSKTTVFSILRNLTDLGYVRKTQDGRFHLGLGLYSLGMKAMRQVRQTDAFLPELTALRDELGHTVHACGFLNGETVVLEKLDGSGGIVFKSYQGERKPLHLSAGGKAILAFVPEDEYCRYAAGELAGRTRNSITGREQLDACREQVRRDGFSLDDEEGELGVFCFGAPLFASGGAVFGAISVSTIKALVDIAAYSAYSRRILQAAERISRNLGYHGPYPPETE